jgi:hypothetical protein
MIKGNRSKGARHELPGKLKSGVGNPVGFAQKEAKGKTQKREMAHAMFLISCFPVASLACTQTRNAESTSANTVQADVLGTSGNFLVLGASTVTNTGPTVIMGSLGLSPGSAITGFPPGLVDGTTDAADAPAGQAQTDLVAAWTTLKNEPCQFTLTNPDLGGVIATPGVYCFASPSAGLTGALTLDAQGKADARFVFQIASTLTTATASSVLRINGGSDCNVFWEVGSSATLGTSTQFRGNILASTSITVTTSATVWGRLLAHTGAVTLDSNTVRSCADVTAEAGPGNASDAGEDAFVSGPDAASVDEAQASGSGSSGSASSGSAGGSSGSSGSSSGDVSGSSSGSGSGSDSTSADAGTDGSSGGNDSGDDSATDASVECCADGSCQPVAD